jgi:hypothetical protein
MATTDARTRRGDPAFAGDDRITHEPVVEEDRPSPLPDPESLRRPFPWAIVAVVLGFAACAVVAGSSAGWAFGVPFGVVAVLAGAFFGTHWSMGRAHPADSRDSVPKVRFDEDDASRPGGRVSSRF